VALNAPAKRSASVTRKVEDTSSGCRDRASASLVAAAAMDTANGQSRMEASAAAWSSRADLLLRVEQLHEQRRVLTQQGRQRDLAVARREPDVNAD
jgi:hypothetical protein